MARKLKSAKEKKSNKAQGDSDSPAAIVGNRGSDIIASGLTTALNDLKNQKGSTHGFLGVEKKSLEPSEYVNGLNDPKKPDQKLRKPHHD